MAKSRKYTPDVVDAICNGIALGMTETHAAEYGGISYDTYARWRDGKAEFAERLREAKTKRRATWLAMLRKAGEKDWRAIADLLDRCEPDYRKKAGIEVTGEGGGPIVVLFGTDTKGPQ